MKAIAKNENVYIKVSGLVSEDDPNNIQVAHSKPFVDEVVRLFGFNRIMYGSDWPVSSVNLSYSEVLEHAIGCLGEISNDQEMAFFFENARSFYKI